MWQDYTGTVIKGDPYGPGKNDVHLKVGKITYLLRRIGGSSLHGDGELEKLVGKTIRCRGETFGNMLIMTSWDEVAEAAS